MGVDVCHTNHAEADQDDMDAADPVGAAGVNFVMGVPGADDIMLGYQARRSTRSPCATCSAAVRRRVRTWSRGKPHRRRRTYSSSRHTQPLPRPRQTDDHGSHAFQEIF